MEIARGYRNKIAELFNEAGEIQLKIRAEGSHPCDFCCFGLDANDKLSDDRYMIFYNQLEAPQQEISCRLGTNEAVYSIFLSRLPNTIEKLVFTLSGDDDVLVSAFQSFEFELSQGAQTLHTVLGGAEFRLEKAIIAFEIYKKQGLWRMNYVARGYNGGLSKLLAEFGGEEIAEEEAVPMQDSRGSLAKTADELTQDVMKKVSLAKDKEKLEHHVVSLSKCVVDLRKESGVDLGAVRAKVSVVLDYSYSMTKLYQDGTVQNTINRLVPLGLTFDDNASIDVYLFTHSFRKLQDLTLQNYETYVKQVISKSGFTMGSTHYAPVLKAIIEGDSHVEVNYKEEKTLFFFNKKTPYRETIETQALVDDGDPTFVLFITDGDNFDKDETNRMIKKSSPMNVFIQFIGIGRDNFSYLMQLDDLQGRQRDNTGFSKMRDLNQVDDKTLYMAVLEQFSLWLKGAQ